MTRLYLIHWKEEEAVKRLEELKTQGYRVTLFHRDGNDTMGPIVNALPDVYLIDLTRLPSHGREVACALRQRISTREIPLVFIDGDPVKVAHIRNLLPDAIYTDWSNVQIAIQNAMNNPKSTLKIPPLTMENYKDTPLMKKLGVKPGMVVATIDAPDDINEIFQTLPERVILSMRPKSKRDLTIWFVQSEKKLTMGIVKACNQSEGSPLWIAWKKRSYNPKSDVTEKIVREAGLAAGWVDYKICSINEVWSGLLFQKRKR